jgi:hypothetical protein
LGAHPSSKSHAVPTDHFTKSTRLTSDSTSNIHHDLFSSSSKHTTTMLHYRTEGYNGYAIKYSPFFDNRLACAASANFGLVGNGRLYILGLTAQGIVGEKWFDTQDGLFDTAWSEIHENQIGVASGDGSIKLFDIALNVMCSLWPRLLPACVELQT